MALILHHSHPARIGKNDARIIGTLGYVVDHYVIQRAGIAVLTLHKQIIARDLVIKHPLGNLKLGRLLTHRVQQRPHLRLSHRKHIVLKEERTDSYKHHQHNQRTHGLDQRHSRRLHGCKLKMLAEITKRHEACKQNGKRQRHRYHGQCGIKKQLAKHIHTQTLAYKIVDIAPKKLHQHYK